MSLANSAEGRVISLVFFVRLTPPQGSLLGETDSAMKIGEGIAHEAMLLLKRAGEAEGFAVDVRVQPAQY